MSQEASSRPALLESVGEFAVAPLRADAFEALGPRERALAFYLYRAAIAGRDIYYDQVGRQNVELRDLLEEILTHPRSLDAQFREALLRYLKLFWLNNGNHNERTQRKFLPAFSYDQLRTAARLALEDGAEIRLALGESLDQKLERLRPVLFDPSVDPLVTCKTPPPDQDIITCSSVNYYEGVTLEDLSGFAERYPLNSRLVRRDGRLVEEVYRAGRGDVPPGRYARELRTIIGFLQKAEPFAEEPQRRLLRRLSDYLATGDPAEFRAYNLDWIGTEPRVDTVNGFIETYKDPRSRKGAWQGAVYIVDQERMHLQKSLAAEAPYFEERAPWDDRFKRKGFKAPVASAVQLLVAVGDGGSMPPVGVNLPNEEEISEKHGSRSFLLVNVIEARSRALQDRMTDEFALPEDRPLLKQYGTEAAVVLTAMHETLGHAAGKVDDALEGDPQARLREQYATLEEARADLVALYHIFDPRLLAIGAVSSHQVAEAAYRDYVVHDLAMLRRVREGDVLEDDHMRATHLIVSWLAREGSVAIVRRDGKAYPSVADLGAMRSGVGRLLSEVQRIKGEGNAAAARDLVTRFSHRIDPRLRDEIVARADRSGIPSYTAYVMPEIVPVRDGAGEVVDARIAYPTDLALQMLRWSGKLPLEAAPAR